MLTFLYQASPNTATRCTCRPDHPTIYTWACGHTVEQATPAPYYCPVARVRSPNRLCHGFENVQRTSSKNRMVKCRECRNPENPGPKSDGDDTGASGPAVQNTSDVVNA